MRAEAAYKLGWCFVQTKETDQAIDAFAYFLQAFPTIRRCRRLSPNARSPTRKAKNTTRPGRSRALLAKFPKAREREAALQQKALILGQQDNAKGMSDAFQQLLKEFPKSAVAAQANYYIGKAAFEAKDYKNAIAEMNKARQLNKEQYGNLATLRIMSSYFYLKEREALTNEVNEFYGNFA